MTGSITYKVLVLACFLAAVFAQEPEQEGVDSAEAALVAREGEDLETTKLRLAAEKLADEQASRAVYSFATSLVDGIMDNTQGRTETRNGKNVTGSYSYSDGWFRHWIDYVADQYGYRIVSEKTEPIGDGPKIDVEGKADVHTSIAGQNVEYTITKADIGNANLEKKIEKSLA